MTLRRLFNREAPLAHRHFIIESPDGDKAKNYQWACDVGPREPVVTLDDIVRGVMRTFELRPLPPGVHGVGPHEARYVQIAERAW